VLADLRGDLPAELIVEALNGIIDGVCVGMREGRVAPATAARHLLGILSGGIVARPHS
jgi:hypothetical protein